MMMNFKFYKMKRLLNLDFLPINNDLALLIFRIWVSLSLFYKHGIEKFVKFDEISHLPNALDPLHIGVLPTLCYATFTDGICSLLIMLGLCTRLSSLFLLGTLLVVFFFFHGGSFIEEHAEIVYLYLGSYIYLACIGAGKYSLDNRLFNYNDKNK
jgi:putative oxidoreductase